jgi:hypothetical protein
LEVVVEEPQGGQVADQLLVDAGLRGEVEVAQGPGVREAGEPQPAGEGPAFLGGVDLDLQQPLQGGGHGQVLVPDLVQHPAGALRRRCRV